jgi:hypothetical protein
MASGAQRTSSAQPVIPSVRQSIAASRVLPANHTGSQRRLGFDAPSCKDRS